MERIAKAKQPRSRSRLATSRSLSNAEKAIAEGDRTIGEISEMVVMEGARSERLDAPLPDIDLVSVKPPDGGVSDLSRAMFGMPVAPLMFCILSIGSVAGVFLGFALDGSSFQRDIVNLILTLI
ncbi:TPA: hypothetical protein ACKRQV_000220 [Pseudomonas aeruginosa]|nr:hypothetical protein [Pseudomonas aeruginosa]EIU2862502.1 hypothetical protein [Pseudomonas aeruginosa]